jgi:hypothetical protein
VWKPTLRRRGLLGLEPGAVAGALGVRVAVDEFDDRHGRHVAIAEARLEDTDIAAVPLLVAGAQHLEELGHMGVLLEPARGQTAGVEVAALAERDELLDDALQVLGLRAGSS